MNNDSGEKKPGGESNTKAFIVLVALTLVFVGVVGGAFFGGTIVGKNQAEDSAAVRILPHCPRGPPRPLHSSASRPSPARPTRPPSS